MQAFTIHVTIPGTIKSPREAEAQGKFTDTRRALQKQGVGHPVALRQEIPKKPLWDFKSYYAAELSHVVDFISLGDGCPTRVYL